MEIIFFIKCFIIGFFVVAPLGPTGILCLRRTFLEGYIPGLLSGLGVATSVGIYSFIAGFGVTSVFNFLIFYQLWLCLLSGIILCFLGIYTFHQASLIKISSAPNKTSHIGAYISTLILSLINPAVVISYMTLFAVYWSCLQRNEFNVLIDNCCRSICRFGFLVGYNERNHQYAEF